MNTFKKNLIFIITINLFCGNVMATNFKNNKEQSIIKKIKDDKDDDVKNKSFFSKHNFFYLLFSGVIGGGILLFYFYHKHEKKINNDFLVKNLKEYKESENDFWFKELKKYKESNRDEGEIIEERIYAISRYEKLNDYAIANKDINSLYPLLDEYKKKNINIIYNDVSRICANMGLSDSCLLIYKILIYSVLVKNLSYIQGFDRILILICKKISGGKQLTDLTQEEIAKICYIYENIIEILLNTNGFLTKSGFKFDFDLQKIQSFNDLILKKFNENENKNKTNIGIGNLNSMLASFLVSSFASLFVCIFGIERTIKIVDFIFNFTKISDLNNTLNSIFYYASFEILEYIVKENIKYSDLTVSLFNENGSYFKKISEEEFIVFLNKTFFKIKTENLTLNLS